MAIEKNRILELLKEIKDPELKRDIVSLGMIKEIRIEGRQVRIELVVTSASEEVRKVLKRTIEEKLSPEKEIEHLEIEISRAKPQGPVFSKSPLPNIGNIVAVGSGKGGVGKTTVSVNLSLALARMGNKVGLMDGDIYGPNVPLMLGIPADTRPQVNEDQKIVPLEALGIKMISMGVLVPADQPMVWRGPMLHGAVTQFLQKVEWGPLDFLIVDLPPGTGDVQLSLVQTVPITGAVMVTTPQEVALMDVRKGILMFQKTQVPILGVIENMSGDIFGTDGGRLVAKQFNVPFLGQIRLDADVRRGGDSGKPIVISKPDSAVSKNFIKAAELLIESLSGVAHE